VLEPVPSYTGRLAPSPTGRLHLGHARTFWIAAERARQAGGRLLLRMDNLDRDRCRDEYAQAALSDLAWLGLHSEAPVIVQSTRIARYRQALAQLHAAGFIFPCERSRRDVREAAGAPHEDDEEPIYPREFRPPAAAKVPPLGDVIHTNWRFRVPDGETLAFNDALVGPQSAEAGCDFGDFLVWRKDDLPSYQLASVVDDIDFGITEVVRGADLIRSTFRQLLLFHALGAPAPTFAHCALMRDESGRRLAKRHDALSLQTLRDQGVTPVDITAKFSAQS
jgi:glutamyl-tRNA synthetase